MKLGENIRDYRKKAGLSLRELADMVDVTYATLSRYENGKTVPKYDTLKKIARALGVDSVYYLYGDEDRDEYDRMMQEKAEENELYRFTLSAQRLAMWQHEIGRLVVIYDGLSQDGQMKLIEYAEDLAASGRYKKSDRERQKKKSE